jgi:hypothetical protein
MATNDGLSLETWHHFNLLSPVCQFRNHQFSTRNPMEPAHVRGDGPKVNIPLRASLNEAAQFPLHLLFAVDLILSSHIQLYAL